VYCLIFPSIDVKSLRQAPKRPSHQHELVEGFWIEAGDQPVQAVPEYILTPYVREQLRHLARAAVIRRYPLLLQGPTSAGKTSMVEYLAKITGHRFVRINNHEHTDLQEYLGGYASDETGRLVFREGILVEAVRKVSSIDTL